MSKIQRALLSVSDKWVWLSWVKPSRARRTAHRIGRYSSTIAHSRHGGDVGLNLTGFPRYWESGRPCIPQCTAAY